MATVGHFFKRLNGQREERLRRESYEQPILRRHGRESFLYFEEGRSTLIACDFALGMRDLDFVVYRTPLEWRETGKPLTEEESDRIFSKFPELLAEQKIRWAFSEMVSYRRKQSE